MLTSPLRPGAIHAVPSLGPTARVVVLRPAHGAAPETSVIVAPLYALPDPARATALDFCLSAEETPDHAPLIAALWNTRPLLVTDVGPMLGALPEPVLTVLQAAYDAVTSSGVPLDSLRLGRDPVDLDTVTLRHHEQARWQALTGRVLAADGGPSPSSASVPPGPQEAERAPTDLAAIDALCRAPSSEAWQAQALALLAHRTTPVSDALTRALFVEPPPVPVYLPMRQAVVLAYLRGPWRSATGDAAVQAWWTEGTTGRAPNATDREIARALHGRPTRGPGPSRTP